MLLHLWTKIYLHRCAQTLSVLAYDDKKHCASSILIRCVSVAFTILIYGRVHTKYLASSFGSVGVFTFRGH